MTLWLCTRCGLVRESETPLGCRSRNHELGLPMEVMGADGPTFMGAAPPHAVYGRTATDKGYEYLSDRSLVIELPEATG